LLQRVAAGLRSGDVVKDQLRTLQNARGLYIVTASSAIQTAREVKATEGGTVMGQFTAALVDGIRTGAADQDRDGLIMLRELVSHVQANLKHQSPQFLAVRSDGDPTISLNPATDALLPQEVAEGLTAESALTRIGAAWRLSRLAVDADDSLKAAAAKRCIVERLYGDESERDHLVRVALQEALPLEIPGFSADNSDLTGVWKGNDDCTYYIRQLGNEIWWYGEGTSDWQAFTNVAYGTVEDNGVVRLRWSDLPKVPKTPKHEVTTSAGELVLKCNYSIQRGYVTDLASLSMTGQFGGSSWTRMRSQQPK
jgi:hypothetical protein